MESVEAVKRNGGITVTYNGLEYHVPVEPRHYRSPHGKCQFILNAVKAYQVENTIELLRELSSGESLILMFQNGFGSLEFIEEKFPYNHVAGAVVFIGAERVSRNHVIHHGGETIFAGCRKGFCSDLLELQNILRRGGCDFRVVSDIDFYRWLKLAVNAVINPLTAITRSKNKIVLTKPGKELARMIIEEVIEAARRNGYMLDPDRLYKIVLRNAMNTAENYSSMAQDIMSGRKTEVDYINGFIAKKLDREYSINNILVKIVHLIEEAK